MSDMVTCDSIDLLAVLERGILSEAERQHLEQCSECREELARLRKLDRMMMGYFQEQESVCPERDEILECVIERGDPLPSGLKEHAASCPECARALEHAVAVVDEAEPDYSPEAMPEEVAAAVAAYKKQRLKARTMGALEGLVDSGKKGAAWFKGIAGRALGEDAPMGAPAAPKDLTRAEGEGEEPDLKPDDASDESGKESDDK